MQSSSPFEEVMVTHGMVQRSTDNNVQWSAPQLQFTGAREWDTTLNYASSQTSKNQKEVDPALLSRTYYRRKEEKKILERQLHGLNAQLQHLARRREYAKRRERFEARKKQNQLLRSSILGQRVIFANTQSMMSEFLRGPDHSRNEPVIRLGTDLRERYNTLIAMKQERLYEITHFLTERSRYMAMDTDFTDLQRFQAANGDVCLVRFDIKPFHQAQSVKQAFEGVLKFSYNMEISISDLMGDITVRENDDVDWDSSVAQHRLVTSINPDVKVDTNNVTFTQYWGDSSGPQVERTVGDELGLAVCNYVEEDALYPYRESERVRQDITFQIMIAKYPRQLKPSSTTSECATYRVNSGKNKEQGDLVVATRWTCLRLRKPPFPLDECIASHIRDGMEQVGQAMFTSIRHSVSNHPTRTGQDSRCD